jgi:hypothetical protein
MCSVNKKIPTIWIGCDDEDIVYDEEPKNIGSEFDQEYEAFVVKKAYDDLLKQNEMLKTLVQMVIDDGSQPIPMAGYFIGSDVYQLLSDKMTEMKGASN